MVTRERVASPEGQVESSPINNILELHLNSKRFSRQKIFKADECCLGYFEKVMSSSNTQLRVLFINKILRFTRLA